MGLGIGRSWFSLPSDTCCFVFGVKVGKCRRFLPVFAENLSEDDTVAKKAAKKAAPKKAAKKAAPKKAAKKKK